MMTPEERRAKKRRYYYDHYEKGKKYRQAHAKERSAKSMEWRRKNKDRYDAVRRAYRAKNIEKFRAHDKANKFRKQYGITLAEYEKMLAKQNGLCAICGKTETMYQGRLLVDHDHESGRIRKLLCVNCNCALGYVNDNTEILQKMIDYLTAHKQAQPLQPSLL